MIGGVIAASGYGDLYGTIEGANQTTKGKKVIEMVYRQYEQVDEALKRGTDAVRQQGAVLLEQERQERERAEQEAQQSMHQMLAGLESQAVESFSGLQGLYTERQQAAQAALEVLARFARVEGEIKRQEKGIVGELTPVLNLTPANRVHARIIELRKRGGLPSEHENLGLRAPGDESGKTAITALVGIALGAIGAGFVQIGTKSRRIDP